MNLKKKSMRLVIFRTTTRFEKRVNKIVVVVDASPPPSTALIVDARLEAHSTLGGSCLINLVFILNNIRNVLIAIMVSASTCFFI